MGKMTALRAGGLDATSRSVGQTLADDASQRAVSAGQVVNPKPDPVAVPEIVFRQIPEKMLFGAMLIDALKAALKHAVEAFNSVGVNVAADIFAGLMAGETMRRKVLVDTAVVAGFIGHNDGLWRDIRFQDWQNFRAAGAADMKGPATLATFYKSKHGVFVSSTALLHGNAGDLADEGFVSFHNPVIAAHRAGIAGAHRFADAVRHEPSGFQGDAQGAVKLVAADAFLAAANQVNGLQPQLHFNMARLKDSAHLHGKRLAAGIALVKANASGITAHFAHALIALAVKAYRAMRPQLAFNERVSGFFILKVRGV